MKEVKDFLKKFEFKRLGLGLNYCLDDDGIS